MSRKDEIIELAKKRGFELWATLGGVKLQFMDDRGINLFVNINSSDFELKYSVPDTIFQLICPPCSPFDHEAHFNSIYRKFKRECSECWEHLR